MSRRRNQLDILNSTNAVHGEKADGFAIRNAYINHGLPPLDNVDVRRALAWAWDADGYNEVYEGGTGVPATSYLSRLHWAHIDVPEHPKFDVEKAKVFMAASGVPESERKLRITGNTVAFQFVQAAWEKIGFQSEHIADRTGRYSRARGDENPDIHMSVGSRITSRPDPGWQTNVMLRSDAITILAGRPRQHRRTLRQGTRDIRYRRAQGGLRGNSTHPRRSAIRTTPEGRYPVLGPRARRGRRHSSLRHGPRRLPLSALQGVGDRYLNLPLDEIGDTPSGVCPLDGQ